MVPAIKPAPAVITVHDLVGLAGVEVVECSLSPSAQASLGGVERIVWNYSSENGSHPLSGDRELSGSSTTARVNKSCILEDRSLYSTHSARTVQRVCSCLGCQPGSHCSAVADIGTHVHLQQPHAVVLIDQKVKAKPLEASLHAIPHTR
jgi:hypothetical protein